MMADQGSSVVALVDVEALLWSAGWMARHRDAVDLVTRRQLEVDQQLVTVIDGVAEERLGELSDTLAALLEQLTEQYDRDLDDYEARFARSVAVAAAQADLDVRVEFVDDGQARADTDPVIASVLAWAQEMTDVPGGGADPLVRATTALGIAIWRAES